MKSIKRKKTLRKRKKIFRRKNNHITFKKGKKHIIKMTGGIPPDYATKIMSTISPGELEKVKINSETIIKADLANYDAAIQSGDDIKKREIVLRYVSRDMIFKESLTEFLNYMYDKCQNETFTRRPKQMLEIITTEEEKTQLILKAARIYTSIIDEQFKPNNTLYTEKKIISDFGEENILHMTCLEITKLLLLLFQSYLYYLPQFARKLNDY
jgi:hypothetical protein